MTLRLSKVLVGMVILAGAAGYLFLLHRETAPATSSVLGAFLAVLPMVLAAAWLAWSSRWRRILMTLWVLVVAGLLALHDFLADHFAYVGLIQHAGTFASLTAVFGVSLFKGRTPMISLFARAVHGELPPCLAVYTRNATIAWTLVFALMASTSLLLFFSGAMAIWSLLVNILTPIIVAVVFVVEFLLRKVFLPPQHHTGLIASVRAAWPAFDQFAADARRSRPPDPRV